MRRELRRFRPMGIADILDETVELYRNNFALLIGIAAVAYVPYFLVEGFAPGMDITSTGTAADVGVGPVLAFLALVFLFVLLVEPIVTGALTFAISDRYLGRETSILSCFRRILTPSILFRFIGAVMLKYMIIAGALFVVIIAVAIVIMGLVASAGAGLGPTVIAVLLSIPLGAAALFLVIYVMVRLALVEPCFIIEMTGAGGAIARAWRLIQGNVGKGFVLLLVAGVVAILIPQIVTLPTQLAISWRPEGGPPPSHAVVVIDLILRAVVSTLLVPVTSIVTILLYYDIRIRKEGFDLQLLANELDAKTRQFSAPDITALPQERPPTGHVNERSPPGDDAQ